MPNFGRCDDHSSINKECYGPPNANYKKNESGILNQNLYGSDEGYETQKTRDPNGSGYAFAIVACPGKNYNMGNVFREKYMGNLQ